MPGSKQHQSFAKWGLGFKLSKIMMKTIDHLIDGCASHDAPEYGNLIEGEIGTIRLQHDSYEKSPPIFQKILDWAYSKSGNEGAEYCFFHIFYDKYRSWEKKKLNKINWEILIRNGIEKLEKERPHMIREVLRRAEELIRCNYPKYLEQWHHLRDRILSS